MIRFLIISAIYCRLAGCVSVLPDPGSAGGLLPDRPDPTAERAESDGAHPRTGSLAPFFWPHPAAEDETGALRVVRGVQWTDNATDMMLGGLLDALNGEGEHAALPPARPGRPTMKSPGG